MKSPRRRDVHGFGHTARRSGTLGPSFRLFRLKHRRIFTSMSIEPVPVLDCDKEVDSLIVDSGELLKFDKVNPSLTKFTFRDIGVGFS